MEVQPVGMGNPLVGVPIDAEEPRILTIQDLVDESKKPVLIPINFMGGSIKYMRLTSEEEEELSDRTDKEINNIKERYRLDNCNPKTGELLPGRSLDKVVLERKRSTILSDLKLWKGLNKADSTITETMVKSIPSDIKNQINIFLTQQMFNDMSEEQLGKYMNLVNLTKDL